MYYSSGNYEAFECHSIHLGEEQRDGALPAPWLTRYHEVPGIMRE